MHVVWSGSISFGLVTIPVKMFSGSQSRDGIDLDMLHKKDKSPIRYARVCRKDGQEVPYEDIVKGYAIADDEYIVLTDEDLEQANVQKSKSIRIKQFAAAAEIDSRYYDKPYYLEPDNGGEHAYALLRDALAASDKVALGLLAMRTRENMGAITPLGNGLLFNQMRFPADLRQPTELVFPDEKANKEELRMALELIKQLDKPFIPEDWHDTYTEELEALIKRKAKGHKTATTAHTLPDATKAQDLMAALQASLKKQKA
jgi:DNA end-binding protein Ku